uniref:Uncharacterized protein n=1 Tax=viral metagenome TaxID=1070528 RepID=A0A6C0D2I3_9ZZZZ
MHKTLITHIYNEQYLLPFWLEHHKNMFDNIVIVDYHSTDKSLEICKSICPECKIITTRNEFFDASKVDAEIMDLENTIKGIKIVLNTTEFLFCKNQIHSLFSNEHISYSIKSYAPYCIDNIELNDYKHFINKLIDPNVKYIQQEDRGLRQIHNFSNGNYTIGRHNTNNITIDTNDMYIIWLGYFPFNDKLIERKLQIKNKMPESDKQKGFGIQHLNTKEDIIEINKKNVDNAKPLNEINMDLYNILIDLNKLTNSTNSIEGFENENRSKLFFMFIFLFFIFFVIFLYFFVNYKKNKIIKRIYNRINYFI